MLKRLLIALLVCVSVVMSGCAGVTRAVEESPTTARLAVQYATMKVIEQSSHITAADVLDHVERVRSIVTNDKPITLAALTNEVREGIRWDRLSPADAMLLDALLMEAEAQLWARIGEGLLSAEAKATISTLLDWIANSARRVRVSGWLGAEAAEMARSFRLACIVQNWGAEEV